MNYKPFFTPEFEERLKKTTKKDKKLLEKIKKAIKRLCENPESGKPLRYDLKGKRRIHLNPFVLVYSIEGSVVVFHYIDHHDDAY